jgi:hypothetical protein
MAGLKCYVSMPPVTLGASGGWKSLMFLAVPSNLRAIIDSWGVTPKGTVNSDPAVQFRLVKASSVGTGGTALTIAKRNSAFAENPATAGFVAKSASWTAEPTSTGEALDLKNCHPQGGMDFPTFERGAIQIGGGETVLLQYNNDSGGASIDCGAEVAFEY